ncbi:glycosyltransferase family 1 protein [Chaetomium strumarium]|uniref:Glycosyltransferase family 1 protein n=1 Tax=Chaetomium strumarium TaxID=1170767 RepID=A0AAJ0GRL0_9PEZI|nr:glycosyltransferase family 1 protein [Chaetomium strumarium]
MDTPKDRPILVAAAFSASGHMTPLLHISEHLVKRGFQVYFITGAEFKASVEKIGATFVENPFQWEQIYFTQAPKVHDETWVMKYIFGDATPHTHRALKETLERVRREHPGCEVVILHESFAGGLGPFVCGAPLPEGYTSLPKAIVFHSSVYASADDQTPPFGPGFRYDPTPENLALWRSTREAMEPGYQGVVAHYNALYQTLGATRPIKDDFLEFVLSLGDATVLATSPSLEYPIRNKPARLRLIGGLPPKPVSPDFAYPVWWPTITSNAALPAGDANKKRVVFVTQGTIHLDYSELLLPTLKALANRADVIVVATLGARGAELEKKPKDDPAWQLPSNALVIDYLPYNALLPYADVFVSNAGYGGFMHGVMNGVPMVLAGALADKGEVCARAEFAGIAINLAAQKPGEDAIGQAVNRVLADEKFKARAMELKKENDEMDALGTFEGIIWEMVGLK